MSGVTTRAFRQLISECSAVGSGLMNCLGLTVSEFVSVEGMTRGNHRTMDMIARFSDEAPFAVQIFGYDIYRMTEAARLVQDSGADILDINCGCPAPKVVKRGGGCELMRQPQHLQEILRSVRKAVSIPLTLKMRSGWDSNVKNAVEIAHICEGEGVDGITVHGRTRVELYRGRADWGIVREVANSVSIPVCGSGDIVDAASAYLALHDEDGARNKIAGLYIGRAAMNDPYIFKRITSSSSFNRPYDWKLSTMERYVELLEEYLPPTAIPGKIKQLAAQMGTGEIWAVPICRARSLDEQKVILSEARLNRCEASHLSMFAK
jgi:nifR3 family TIM-barrel protein